MYLAATPASALVEILVHLELRDGAFPRSFQLLKVQVPETVSRERLEEATLAPDWIQDNRISRGAGDRWIDEARSALLEVPSAIIPETSNWLLNPMHPDSAAISIAWHRPYPYDGRLFRPRK